MLGQVKNKKPECLGLFQWLGKGTRVQRLTNNEPSGLYDSLAGQAWTIPE